MYRLAPSMLAADFTRLGEEIHAVEEVGAHYLHIDVMDGAFVPCISFGMPVIESLRGSTKLLFDVHLMVEKPERYIEEFAEKGAIDYGSCGGYTASGPRHLADQKYWKKGRGCTESIHRLICAGICAGQCGHGASDDGKSRIWRPEIHSILHGKNSQTA